MLVALNGRKIQHQQSKNLRVNGCILNDIRVVSDNDKVSTLTMDWVGKFLFMLRP